MRQRVVDLHLDHFRIDHDETQLFRREPVEHARDERVDADAFAAAGRAGDEQMRHLREIGDDGFAVNIFAERERELRGSLPFQSSDCKSSRSVTLTLRLFASSMPTVSLPGIGARMLIRSARVARARSRSRLTILSTRTPFAG